MKKENLYKALFYFLGLAILSLGLILNSKSNLGVSPIVSVAYIFSIITGITLSRATLYQYIIFIVVQMILHIIQKVENLKIKLIEDVLQLVVSFIFTAFMSLYSNYIPLATTTKNKILFLIFGVLFTGTGAAMSLVVRFIPNPGDGITQAISDTIHKKLGTTKNIVDFVCVCLTVAISLIFKKEIIGIGLGTVVCVIMTGRVIALFNDLFKNKIEGLCGFKNQEG